MMMMGPCNQADHDRVNKLMKHKLAINDNKQNLSTLARYGVGTTTVT